MRTESHLVRAASWAGDLAVRPAANSEIVNAVVWIREVNDCFLKALWFAHGLALHEQNINLNVWMSQVNNHPNKAGGSPLENCSKAKLLAGWRVIVLLSVVGAEKFFCGDRHQQSSKDILVDC